MKVFLIGYMGSGKTTIGKRLANKLSVPFYDTDQLIEEQTNLSINSIFEQQGENAFRTLEKDIIQSITDKDTIVATGGGLPCHNQMIDELNKQGITIYLQRPAKELAQRLANAKTERPLIAHLEEDELIDFIELQLADREKQYNRAKIIASRNEQKVEQLINLIKEYATQKK